MRHLQLNSSSQTASIISVKKASGIFQKKNCYQFPLVNLNIHHFYHFWIGYMALALNQEEICTQDALL